MKNILYRTGRKTKDQSLNKMLIVEAKGYGAEKATGLDLYSAESIKEFKMLINCYSYSPELYEKLYRIKI